MGIRRRLEKGGSPVTKGLFWQAPYKGCQLVVLGDPGFRRTGAFDTQGAAEIIRGKNKTVLFLVQINAPVKVTERGIRMQLRRRENATANLSPNCSPSGRARSIFRSTCQSVPVSHSNREPLLPGQYFFRAIQRLKPTTALHAAYRCRLNCFPWGTFRSRHGRQEREC